VHFSFKSLATIVRWHLFRWIWAVLAECRSWWHFLSDQTHDSPHRLQLGSNLDDLVRCLNYWTVAA